MIRISPIRVIDADGAQLGVITRDEALEKARSSGLDLVEVAPLEKPPVCRIMDFGKFKYQQKKKQHKGHVHHSKNKEIRLRPKIGDHDFLTKAGHARKWLGERDKVVCSVIFRGRENAHRDRGREMLEQFVGALADVAAVEQTPRMDSGRQMSAIVKPRPGPVRAAAGRTVAVGDVTPAAD